MATMKLPELFLRGPLVVQRRNSASPVVCGVLKTFETTYLVFKFLQLSPERQMLIVNRPEGKWKDCLHPLAVFVCVSTI